MTGTSLIAPFALALVLLPLTGCGGKDKPSNDVEAGRCDYRSSGASAAKGVDRPPSNPPSDLPSELTIATSAGDVRVTLEPDKAPCAVNSFASLADQGYFDDTPCHRLTTQGYYVLQCGDPTGSGTGGPGYEFDNELVADDPRLQPCGEEAGQSYCTYNTGTVAMANAGTDAEGHGTNGSQFFLVYGNSKFPPDYTVLGHMDAAGLKVVKGIAAVGIDPASASPERPGDGKPARPVTITSVK